MVENKGMCSPISDQDFFNLLTNNGTKDIELILKYYPELNKFIK